MAHLISHVRERRARLYEHASVRMPQIMKADGSQSSARQQQLKNTLREIIHLNRGSRFGWKDQFLRGIRLPLAKALSSRSLRSLRRVPLSWRLMSTRRPRRLLGMSMLLDQRRS